MKLNSRKIVLFFPGLLIILCLCCLEKEQEITAPADKPPHQQQIETKQHENDPNVIAEIDEYIITKKEFENRFLTELRPNPYDLRRNLEKPDAEEVLKTIIAEKAMVIEARKQKLHEDERTREVIRDFKEQKFVNLLLSNYLKDKLFVTSSEVEELIKSDPKLEPEQARVKLMRAKSSKILEKYYNELYQKFHAQKFNENFSGAAQIHQRLLLYPKEPRRLQFIHSSQISDELTAEEKNIVLANYDGGKITLKDWFDALCDMSPPSRPNDLGTEKGVEKLLDRALKMPIFVAEAELQGFDKDKNILKQARDYEDQIVFTTVKREKIKDIIGPIAEERTTAYFNENKELFDTQNTLKIDQFWCRDLKTARKAKDELDEGKEFQKVKQTYSLGGTTEPINTFIGGEGIFFGELWKGEPNEIIGPVKGLHSEGVKWRIVKILEKNPGEIPEYSDDLKRQIEANMLEEQRNSVLKKYQQELLEKYSYEIYTERFRNIDPLDIP